MEKHDVDGDKLFSTISGGKNKKKLIYIKGCCVNSHCRETSNAYTLMQCILSYDYILCNYSEQQHKLIQLCFFVLTPFIQVQLASHPNHFLPHRSETNNKRIHCCSILYRCFCFPTTLH